ncbi:hypothetical protein CNR22_22080 [Sphingobacteriaceae bacterium]|nr:hypothetical protein CNR22_22080 [Sphingobacteriaceae bacterium]
MKPLTKIRAALVIFIVLLVISGVTAFPLRTEMDFLIKHKNAFPDFITLWIEAIYLAISQTPDLVLYGTDWLAFAHIIIALFFIPVFIDPKRYKANLIIAMAACFAVFPLAFICGPVRGIPFFHQLIDCSFGFFGFIPLFYVYKKVKHLNTTTHEYTR